MISKGNKIMTQPASQDPENSHLIHRAQSDGRLRQAQLKMVDMLKVIDKICQKHQLDYWLEGGTLLGAIRHQGFIPWDDDLDISMPRDSYEAFLKLAPSEIPPHMHLQTATTDPGYFNLSVPLKIRDRKSRFIEIHETGCESYQQGIFIDVFVYDALPIDSKQRKRDKWLAKKLLRLLSHKCSSVQMGHHARIYAAIGSLIPKTYLEAKLQDLIELAKISDSPYLGYGYDCVNTNLVTRDDIYPLKRVTFETGQFLIPNRAEAILTQLYGDYMTLPPEQERKMKHCRELIPELDEVEG
ncbi:LicD family protein [Legionella clemsonensis]|uniref:LicD family protein n=1 Tax=Legionella clemsonensis TaxID=1867846 RepID=A0A222P656_9GAMM|nr:LicD family protein [Legionella clemsonensis]ASQ47319.1 LicD family protein [Legionella clemsonensis]